jgi:hypothetical protein
MSRDGSCLCGAVRYRVDGPLREILGCHCVECRRWAGHAWTATAARAADLEIAGSADLHWVPSPRSEHGAERGFCVRCGASLFWRVPGWDRVSIAAGTLDEPSYYQYVDSDIDPTRVYFYYVESISLKGVREKFTPVIRAPAKRPAAGASPAAGPSPAPASPSPSAAPASPSPSPGGR